MIFYGVMMVTNTVMAVISVFTFIKARWAEYNDAAAPSSNSG